MILLPIEFEFDMQAVFYADLHLDTWRWIGGRRHRMVWGGLGKFPQSTHSTYTVHINRRYIWYIGDIHDIFFFMQTTKFFVEITIIILIINLKNTIVNRWEILHCKFLILNATVVISCYGDTNKVYQSHIHSAIVIIGMWVSIQYIDAKRKRTSMFHKASQ